MLKKFYNKYFNKVNWYNLRSVEPVSKVFGLDRGTPVDRYYIEKFLRLNKEAIRGNVLEISEDKYSKKYGCLISSVDILHVDESNKKATIIGDLTDKETLPQDKYDCFICTQTLNFIYDFNKAIEGIYCLLNKGGTALITLAGLCQISHYDMDRWGDYWRFTNRSAEKIFGAVFGSENIIVKIYGNVLTAVALIQGISAEELSDHELDFLDKDYQIIITVKAIKK